MEQQPLQASFQPPDQAWRGQLRFNDTGLIPAIAQDWLDGAVLMVAWMNSEALERSLASGEVHYWSRSRAELWHKAPAAAISKNCAASATTATPMCCYSRLSRWVMWLATRGPAAASLARLPLPPGAPGPCRRRPMSAASSRG